MKVEIIKLPTKENEELHRRPAKITTESKRQREQKNNNSNCEFLLKHSY